MLSATPGARYTPDGENLAHDGHAYMALRLELISRHRQSLGERGVKEFGRAGGTIGRSLESDWVLPDGQRYISSRHASIDFRSGSFYIVDTSTNGVYVNGSETPVGRGKPQRLFSGDRVRMGEYEMTVVIEEEENTRETLVNDKHVDPVERAQRVESPDPTGRDLVDAHEITGVGIEMVLSEEAGAETLRAAARKRVDELRLEDDPPPRQPSRAKPNGAAGQPALNSGPAGPARPGTSPGGRATAPARAQAEQKPAGQPAAPHTASPAGQRSTALAAFFRGAGLPDLAVDDKQVEATLHRLGQLMREMIVGLTENLHVRAEQKGTLRVPNTTIQPQSNNPLKFSAGVDEALNNLFFRQTDDYLSAVDAVREAFVDIKVHQHVLLNALRTALSDYIGRLDPDELESKFSTGRRNALLNATNKLKYWDVYKDLYQVVTQHPPGQFPPQFLEELARAYEHESTRATPVRRATAKTKTA
jgi:type VI secretion system protein